MPGSINEGACILLGSIKNEVLGSINEFKTREKRFFPAQRKGNANVIILFAKSWPLFGSSKALCHGRACMLETRAPRVYIFIYHLIILLGVPGSRSRLRLCFLGVFLFLDCFFKYYFRNILI